jgi:hypothetical protein
LHARRSRWREQTYLYRDVAAVLNPPVGLRRVIKEWPTIRRKLANEPRKRQAIILG